MYGTAHEPNSSKNGSGRVLPGEWLAILMGVRGLRM